MTTHHDDDGDILTSLEDAPLCPECRVMMVWIECENCDGVGYLERHYPVTSTLPVCPPCKGTGGEFTCPECQL